MWDIITRAIQTHHIQVLHTAQTWAFKELGDKHANVHVPGITHLHFVHAINVFRMEQGIFIKWKQYVTDPAWSDPVCIVPARQMARIAALRPSRVQKKFAQKTEMLAWLNKFSTCLQDMQGTYAQHKDAIA